MKTQKMLFHDDKVINGEVIFKAGEVYDIEVETGSVIRWLKRGATIVEEGSVEVSATPEVQAEESKAPIEPEIDEALESLGGEEEVVNEEDKKENKKAKKSSK